MLFNTEDYPDWIEEMYTEAIEYNENIKSDINETVWRIAREYNESPHIGNIVFQELANAIITSIIEEEKLEDIKDAIFEKITVYPDGYGSYISVGGEDITEFQDLLSDILKIAKIIKGDKNDTKRTN